MTNLKGSYKTVLPEDQAKRLLLNTHLVPEEEGVEVKSKSAGPFDIEARPEFQSIIERIEYSQRFIESYSDSSLFTTESEINKILQEILGESMLDGIVVVTWDAFTVFEVSKQESGITSTAIPAIAIMLTEVVKRAKQEQVLDRPKELVLSGIDGEFVIVRYFQNLEWQFILVAYARQKCSYKTATDYAMQLCEPILADYVFM